MQCFREPAQDPPPMPLERPRRSLCEGEGGKWSRRVAVEGRPLRGIPRWREGAACWGYLWVRPWRRSGDRGGPLQGRRPRRRGRTGWTEPEPARAWVKPPWRCPLFRQWRGGKARRPADDAIWPFIQREVAWLCHAAGRQTLPPKKQVEG